MGKNWHKFYIFGIAVSKEYINKIITLQNCNFTKEMFSTKVFSLKPVSAGIEALPTPIHRVPTNFNKRHYRYVFNSSVRRNNTNTGVFQ